MRTLLIILICFPVFAHGQDFQSKLLQANNDPLQLQISYTNYCLNQHRKEMLMGTGLQLIGATFTAVCNLPQLNGMNKAKDTYNREMAIAGDAIDRQLSALRKFEKKERAIQKTQDGSVIVGGILVVGGSILQIYSYRWLNHAYIKPAENGIGIKIEF